MAKKEKDSINFETALGELEDIVSRMEKGDMPLEDSLAAFEKGIQLTRLCQTALKDAEQRVAILMEKSDSDELAPFTPSDVVNKDD